MESAEARRAVVAARATAMELGLAVDDAVVLNDSNRVVVRLLPCDTVVRVTPVTHHAGHQVSPEREVEVVRQLARTDAPVAVLDSRVQPRVLLRDGFTIGFWAHYEPVPSPQVSPANYAQVLGRLHAGLRQIEVATPHALDRVAGVQHDVDNLELTPDLTDTDRIFLADTLRDLRQTILDRHAPDQLLHGEPHPGNLLVTGSGPLIIDFENTAHGPVEYDLGWVPVEVSERYSAADPELVDVCRGLVLAMVAAYRWRSDDRHPSGRASGVAFLDVLRNGPPWPGLDDVTW